jgi:hypothetical protein
MVIAADLLVVRTTSGVYGATYLSMSVGGPQNGVSHMKLIHGDLIRKSLSDVAPTKIAVAYIGADWKEFIDPDILGEIIVSPTLGSNPGAIREIVVKLGWDNVHFLTRLHSKIYIGETKAVLGSFNLSNNGLGAKTGDLEEAGVIFDNVEFIEELSGLYDYYKKSAELSFCSTRDKEIALKLLEDAHNIAVSTQVITSGEIGVGKRNLNDFTPLCDDDFYITYWYTSDLLLNDDVIHEVFPETISRKIEQVFSDRITFSPIDSNQLKKGRWILYWKQTSKGYLDLRSAPKWMLIDEIVENGGKNPGFELVVFERNAHDRLSPPFDLSRDVIRALKQTLCNNKFLPFTSRYASDDMVWSIKDTFPLFKDFVAEWKRANEGTPD